MLSQTIQSQLTIALKEKKELRLSVMRMLLSALNYARIDKMRDLTPEEELDVVRKEAKKRTDAIEMYEKAGDVNRLTQEKEELLILQEFLPQGLSSEELSRIVDETISTEGNDFGKVMKAVMAKTKGAADGKQVSELVRAKLQ